MDACFVFMHVGSEIEVPKMFVDSVRRIMPDSTIIQCTDDHTQEIQGVSRVFRLPLDQRYLMSARLKLFSELRLNHPAIYLDTDMLLIRKVQPIKILGEREVMVCRRDFDRIALFNRKMQGEDFQEYENQPLGVVFPYVACATISRDFNFWEWCYSVLTVIDKKFSRWYGDQEAIKRVIAGLDQHRYGFLEEHLYGCLPEYAGRLRRKPLIIHFKGGFRKAAMFQMNNLLCRASIGSRKDKTDGYRQNAVRFKAHDGVTINDARQISLRDHLALEELPQKLISSNEVRLPHYVRSLHGKQERPFLIRAARVFTTAVFDVIVVKRKYLFHGKSNRLITTGLTHSDYALTWEGFDITGTGPGRAAVHLGTPVSLNESLDSIKLEEGIFIGGDTIVEMNFAHWIFEHLLKFYALDLSNVDWRLPVYVSERVPQRYLLWAELLIGQTLNWHRLDLSRPIRCEKLILSSCPAYRDVKGVPNLWLEGFDFLRSRFLSLALHKSSPRHDDRLKVCFLGRRNASWRRAVNEDELFEIAERELSAIRVDIPALSPLEQASEISNVDVLILFGGADGVMTNFLPSRAIVIEVVAPNHTALFTSFIYCVHHGIRYVRVMGARSEGEVKGPHPLDIDYFVEPEPFRAILKSIGNQMKDHQ